MIAAAFWQQLVLLAVAALFAGGGVALARYFRRQGSGLFTIQAAQGVTVMQDKFIQTLQENYDRVSEELDTSRARIQALEDQMRSFGPMQQQIAQLTQEKAQLETRVAHLETENAELRAQIERKG